MSTNCMLTNPYGAGWDLCIINLEVRRCFGLRLNITTDMNGTAETKFLELDWAIGNATGYWSLVPIWGILAFAQADLDISALGTLHAVNFMGRFPVPERCPKKKWK